MHCNYHFQRHTEDDLMEHKQQVRSALSATTLSDVFHNMMQVQQLQQELAEYQLAYQETEVQKAALEEEAKITAEQLQNSEGMRKRLYDQVTELQGQLAIEEQRSKFCSIL